MKSKLKRLKELIQVTKDLVKDELKAIAFEKETDEIDELIQSVIQEAKKNQKTSSAVVIENEPLYKLTINDKGVQFEPYDKTSSFDSLFIPLEPEELAISKESILNLIPIYVAKSNFPFKIKNLNRISSVLNKQDQVDLVADLLIKMLNFKSTVDHFKKMSIVISSKPTGEITLEDLPIERSN